MKWPARKSLLRIVVVSLAATAALGIVTVLGTGLGPTAARILLSVIVVDVASIVALSCTGTVTSVPHRIAQVTGSVSVCLGLLTGLCLVWWTAVAPIDNAWDGVWRASGVLVIAALTSAHACLMLPLRSGARWSRSTATATVLCAVAAAELLANFAAFPRFNPGDAYLKALAVLLILAVLGTILTVLLRRFGPQRPHGVPARTPAGHPSPSTSAAKLPVP